MMTQRTSGASLRASEQLHAFRARSVEYLRLGHDRRAAARFVVDAAGKLRGPALDVGTGKGLLAIELARRGLEVVSVDVSTSQATLESLCTAEHSECLMCGLSNPLGLKLRFRVQPDGSVLAMFPCREAFRSYPETLHGGVISALLDAAMTNALFSVGVVGVTAELTVRFLAPVALNREALVRASVERDTHPLFHVRAELKQDRKLMARATAKFLVKGCK